MQQYTTRARIRAEIAAVGQVDHIKSARRRGRLLNQELGENRLLPRPPYLYSLRRAGEDEETMMRTTHQNGGGSTPHWFASLTEQPNL